MTRTRLTIGGQSVAPGDEVRVDIPVAGLPTQTMLHLPVTVIRGTRPGPRVFLSAALLGDELDGVEVIRRVLDRLSPLLTMGLTFGLAVGLSAQ